MRGHNLLKWLFLTVLSVSTLHFREAGQAGHYRIEQTFRQQRYGPKQVLHYQTSKPARRGLQLAHYKEAQSVLFAALSTALSFEAIDLSRQNYGLAPSVNFNIQSQHFHSRSRSGEALLIFRS